MQPPRQWPGEKVVDMTGYPEALGVGIRGQGRGSVSCSEVDGGESGVEGQESSAAHLGLKGQLDIHLRWM